MTNNLSKSLQILADKTIYSKTTLSEYYNIGCIKVRLSDHMSCNIDSDLAIFAAKGNNRHHIYAVIPMVGTFKEIQWFTNIKGVVEFVVRFESIARLLIKSPISYANTQNGISNENDSAPKEYHGKVDYLEWKSKFSVMYTEKNSELRPILDEIYKLTGDTNTLAKVHAIGMLKHDEKVIQLEKLLNNIKNS